MLTRDVNIFCGILYSEFDEMVRIRREVDKKIGEITSAVQVHSSLSCLYIYYSLEMEL